MRCPHCGMNVSDQAESCPGCGDLFGVSPHKKFSVLLLCFFLGGLGAHRFYVGKNGTGILTIITVFGFFGIWPLIDFIYILMGKFKDKQGRLITR